ncbi:LytR/AlgR family response regulator transcription factor [Fibrella sp. WM1]|uniref:LytR/AlgR family response regulator transcription factor n=1 Tax=Fibrella musci TaxID=3242485 RepID=UPI003522EF63
MIMSLYTTTPNRLDDCLFLGDTHQRYEKVPKINILYLRAEGGWVDVITIQKTYRISTHLGNLEAQLDTDFFQRVSRSHIVNVHRIDAIQHNALTIADQTISIGRQYRSALFARLPVLRTSPMSTAS